VGLAFLSRGQHFNDFFRGSWDWEHVNEEARVSVVSLKKFERRVLVNAPGDDYTRISFACIFDYKKKNLSVVLSRFRRPPGHRAEELKNPLGKI
jgi:hypothetical protein